MPEQPNSFNTKHIPPPVFDHRQAYISRLKTILSEAIDPAVTALISEAEMNSIYTSRASVKAIIAAPEHDIPQLLIDNAERMVSGILKSNQVTIRIGKLQTLSMFEYFSIACTLARYAGALQETDYAHAAEVKKALTPFLELEYSESMQQAWQLYKDMMVTLSLLHSKPAGYAYVVKHQPRAVKANRKRIMLSMEVHLVRAERTELSIHGTPRTIFRASLGLAYPNPHLQYITVSPDSQTAAKGKELNVYFMQQAIIRLKQRIDNIPSGILLSNLIASLKQPCFSTNSKGELLFEYRLFDYKVGYFTTTVSDGNLILTNFLFLTNNSTCEGELLYKSAHITGHNKNYLNINTLSRFVLSDITTNTQVVLAFTEAGCGDLLNIHPSIYQSEEEYLEQLAIDFIAQHIHLFRDATQETA